MCVCNENRCERPCIGDLSPEFRTVRNVRTYTNTRNATEKECHIAQSCVQAKRCTHAAQVCGVDIYCAAAFTHTHPFHVHTRARNNTVMKASLPDAIRTPLSHGVCWWYSPLCGCDNRNVHQLGGGTQHICTHIFLNNQTAIAFVSHMRRYIVDPSVCVCVFVVRGKLTVLILMDWKCERPAYRVRPVRVGRPELR